MKGPVIWVTGLSGAGKTTLCLAIRDALREQAVPCVLLDGDLVREAFGSDLGYAEVDRVRQIQRMQRLARMLAEQELTVLVAALYSNPTLLAWNRTHLPDYFEVYLEASIGALSARDTKQLYGNYAAGRMTNVVGLDIPYTPPEYPDAVFDADEFGDVRSMAEAVIAAALAGRSPAA